MGPRSFASTLATALGFLGALAACLAHAAPAPMTRAEIIALAQSGVGYSYWWGHGAWRTDGTQAGSCSGSCPNCTHSGSYGADCSGYAAKVWQVPSPIAVSSDSHPYSTYNFRYETTHWSQVSRDAIQQADCLVYNADGSGHIVVYESGDPWGSFWAYECKGCSYGCVRNLRTVSSSYVAIRRNAITETVAQGTLQGVVYAGTDANARIPGATVTLHTGAQAIADDPAAYFSFDLPPGDYTVTASAAGYSDRSRTCAVTAGASTWCSIGLTPECTPDCSGRECGPDPACGQSCGACTSGLVCTLAGSCQASCTPQCTGRECGPDPVCGQSCGACPQGAICDATGRCVPCIPDCAGRECGLDPVCGISCGSCTGGLQCSPLWRCEFLTCTPECGERSCGLDPVCGESCGICPANRICNAARGECMAIDATHGKLYGYALVPIGGSETQRTYRHVGGARIGVDTGEQIEADPDGYYEVLVVPGTRTLTVAADGMAPGTHSCTVAAGSFASCQLALAPFTGGEDGDAEMVFGACGATSSWRAGGSGMAASFLLLGLLVGVALLARWPLRRKKLASCRPSCDSQT